MKKISLFALGLVALLFCCTQKQESRSPLEGAWNMVGLTTISGDTIRNYWMPDPEFESQLKFWTKNYWSFIGIGNTDTAEINYFGSGTYTLNGNEYEEKIIYHNDKSLINTTYKALLEIKNDTLYQTSHPVDSMGREMLNYTSVEKYIKVD